MIAILWRYEVKAEHRLEFEATYASDGDWVRLFERSAFYRGTELLRAENGAYVTIDRWRSESDFRAFLAEFGEEYRAMDERTQSWTAEERKLGVFQTLV